VAEICATERKIQQTLIVCRSLNTPEAANTRKNLVCLISLWLAADFASTDFL